MSFFFERCVVIFSLEFKKLVFDRSEDFFKFIVHILESVIILAFFCFLSKSLNIIQFQILVSIKVKQSNRLEVSKIRNLTLPVNHNVF